MMGMNEDLIYITEKDYLRIQHTLKSYKTNESHDLENLELELERARIISDHEVPPDLVTMNSKVRYLQLPENIEATVTVVYPSSVGVGKVSLLSPEGSALLGLRENQKINWMFPDGKTRTLKVLEVLYQPEAKGHWFL